MTAVDIDDLDRMLANATPGPWYTNGPPWLVLGICADVQPRDAALIAALRNAGPGMLAEIRELRALRDLVFEWGLRRREAGIAGQIVESPFPGVDPEPQPERTPAERRAIVVCNALADAADRLAGGLGDWRATYSRPPSKGE